MSDIIVIGAGQAGASLIIKLKKNGFKGSITLIGDEKVIPYQRPPLSCLLYTSPSPRDGLLSRMPSSA